VRPRSIGPRIRGLRPGGAELLELANWLLGAAAVTAEQIRHARDLLTRPGNTVSSIARLLGVSRATIYKYVPEVTDVPEVTAGRQAAAAL
jgi:DNA invertase Pin-like site-specific DNA recombinase